MTSKKVQRIFLLNTPELSKLVNRDMAGGLGFDRRESTLLPPLDLLSYATHLKAIGRTVAFMDAQVENWSPEQIVNDICRFSPDAVVLSLSMPTLDGDISFARKLQDTLHSECRVILKTGIRHEATLQDVLQRSKCDFLIIGECDLTIADILDGESELGTAKLVEDKIFLQNEALLQDLDQLPVLDRSWLKKGAYYYNQFNQPATTLQTSRGCPFGCSYYCPYPLVQGKKWRAMSAERILAELKSIVHEHEIHNVLFRDATFTLKKQRIRDLCDLIKTNDLTFDWWCETRIDCLDIELLDSMRSAGCAGINVGIESGDDGILTDIAKQGTTVSEIAEITKHCKNLGIKLHYLLMVGLPGETRDSLFETFKLVGEMEPESIGITTVTPYPGTALFEDAVTNGWIVESDLNTYGGHGFNMVVEGLSADDLVFARSKIYELFGLNGQPSAAKQPLFREFEEWRRPPFTEQALV